MVLYALRAAQNDSGTTKSTRLYDGKIPFTCRFAPWYCIVSSSLLPGNGRTLPTLSGRLMILERRRKESWRFRYNKGEDTLAVSNAVSGGGFSISSALRSI